MRKIYVTSGDYAFRAIEEDDLPILLEWRNSPEVHSKMLTEHVITWEEHLAWYHRISQLDPCLNFAFTYQGKLVGYQGCTYDREQGIVSPGSYLGVGIFLPVDAGIRMGDMFCEYATSVLKAKKLVVEIFLDNARVLKMNEMCGYKLQEKLFRKHCGVMKEVAVLAMDIKDWKSHV